MGRGSRDWTQLVESGFAHYLDKKVEPVYAAVGTYPTPTEIVNVDIKGVFGYFWLYGNDPHIRPRLVIDGTVVFFQSCYLLRSVGLAGMRNAWQKFSVTRYDAVNNIYAMYYDEAWGLAIHSNLTIDLGYTGGFSGNGYINIHYKEFI